MSIFDVIRYPISWPPTIEELESIPTPLYDAWYKKVNTYEDFRNYKEKIQVLRDIIKEYDNL
jgi:hypothetical protein